MSDCVEKWIRDGDMENVQEEKSGYFILAVSEGKMRVEEVIWFNEVRGFRSGVEDKKKWDIYTKYLVWVLDRN